MAPTKATTYKRSRDRCHMLARIPVYDANGKVLAYHFRYSAGSALKIDALEHKHVMHVLVGFYVRRNMNMFTGEMTAAMLSIPLGPDITKYAAMIHTPRFILRIPTHQEPKLRIQHLTSVLHKAHMRVAADVYTLIYTKWAQSLRAVDFAVIDCSSDVAEQLYLARNIKKAAPWIKIIADKVKTVKEATLLFTQGVDYVACAKIPKAVIRAKADPTFLKNNQEFFFRLLEILADFIRDIPDYNKMEELLAEHRQFLPYIKPLLLKVQKGTDTEEEPVTKIEDAILDLEDRPLQLFMGILICRMMSVCFETEYNRSRGVITFEGINTLLQRAFFVDKLCNSIEADDEADLPRISPFIVGMCSVLDQMAPVQLGETDLSWQDIVQGIAQERKNSKILNTALECAEAIENLDFAKVAEMAKDDLFELKSMIMAYEGSVTETVSIFQMLSKD